MAPKLLIRIITFTRRTSNQMRPFEAGSSHYQFDLISQHDTFLNVLNYHKSCKFAHEEKEEWMATITLGPYSLLVCDCEQSTHVISSKKHKKQKYTAFFITNNNHFEFIFSFIFHFIRKQRYSHVSLPLNSNHSTSDKSHTKLQLNDLEY